MRLSAAALRYYQRLGLIAKSERLDLEIEQLKAKRELMQLAAACGSKTNDACSIHGDMYETR